ncbi:hypothetical protein ACFFX0_15290 [Citricoccus parietis]|uniref:Uncharacterized protein n=1 Tax=Citricoccus parietis TaxID=592307 RepID=A0ABV5G0N4_9MICC
MCPSVTPDCSALGSQGMDRIRSCTGSGEKASMASPAETDRAGWRRATLVRSSWAPRWVSRSR